MEKPPEQAAERLIGEVKVYFEERQRTNMTEGCTRKVVVFPIVVVTSLLLGSFISLADHPPVGQTEWAKYEGSDGYMTVEEDEFDSSGRYQAWVFVGIAPGTGEYFCDTAYTYDFILRDENGSTGTGASQYFTPNPGCETEYLAPFYQIDGGGMREDFYECVMVVGYVQLTTWHGGAGTYEWDTSYKIFVEDLDHPTKGGGGSFIDGCVEVDDSFPLELILGAVAITASIGAVFFYRKKSAATAIVGAVAETKSEEEAEAAVEEVAEEEAVEEEVVEEEAEAAVEEVVEEESPVGDDTVLESEKEQEFLVDDSPSMFCPNCGQKNEMGGKFCKDCGTNLSQ